MQGNICKQTDNKTFERQKSEIRKYILKTLQKYIKE